MLIYRQMIDRSTYFKLRTEPFLLVLLKRVLCSRCGLSSDKLPTKNGKNELKLFLGGLFYIAFVSFSIPKIAPIANTTATPFFIGVQTNVVLPSVVFFEEPVEVLDPCGELSAIISICENGTNTKPSGVSTRADETVGFAIIPFIFWLKMNRSTCCPTIASPFLKRTLGCPLVFGKTPLIISCLALYVFITKKIKTRYKYTNNFFTFYSFKKTDRALAKSFNSFLLPLKFIRSGKVAMEHNGYKYETAGIKCETLSADHK